MLPAFLLFAFLPKEALPEKENGFQYLKVIPGKDLVVVCTARPYTSSELWDKFFELMDLIVAAVD